ncbi:winged helix-turn-helix domain-containing protein [Desulforamulus aeronauticus]|uniref:Molybdate transport system regulatory protein n=1 Tax=Desulforamulus aeronauticus DSM 10349 TaxID=1121421 RepID=A0A1M6UFD8_9FIRM|nr:LysR family transcriptional regulator [Desulforamulus aeronauticus]SHK67952.1 molybdate transport system regulatory protein [Desulforamulus aeronauticus DSM 10349]
MKPFGELFQPGCKIWLVCGGTNFGDGLYHLLYHVHQHGSISKAAKVMGMSYRAAWGKIKNAEKNLGFKLVETQVGGEAGGGACLTPQGSKLLQGFGEFREKVERAVTGIFQETFAGE